MTEQRNEDGAPWEAQAPPPTVPRADRAAPPPSRRLAAVGWLILLLVLLAGAVGTSPYWAPAVAALLPWSPHDGNDAPTARLAQIDQRLGALAQQQAALDQRLARNESQLANTASAATALRDLSARVSALEQRPAPAAGIDRSEIAPLQDNLGKLAAAAGQNADRLAKLEARAAAGQRGDEALLVVLGQLRAQVESGRPFGAELAAAETMSRNRPEIRESLQPLQAAAAKGIPSLAALTQRFAKEAAAPAQRRTTAPPQSADWSEHIWARLRALVVIRRVGDDAAASGDAAEAAVVRGETALSGGDLAGAVAAVESLPAPLPASTQAWLADARARLAAEQALARIIGAATARLAADDRPAANAAPSDEGPAR